MWLVAIILDSTDLETRNKSPAYKNMPSSFVRSVTKSDFLESALQIYLLSYYSRITIIFNFQGLHRKDF